MKRVTDFAHFKQENQPISMVTCYDAWTAKILAGAPVDAILVGDSVSMVVHGFDSTVHATTSMMASHTAAVRRGLGDKFIVTDIPFPEHRKGIQAAMEAVDTIMKAGANAVKIEGVRGHEDVISHIVGSGIPVMGHLGLTPQSVHQLGGYRVQGRDPKDAEQLLEDARSLERSGCFSLVMECVPTELAGQVTQALRIPTIGIGSGPECSGQVLVLQDLLGFNTEFKPRFLRTYAEGSQIVHDAVVRFDADVKALQYPTLQESFSS